MRVAYLFVGTSVVEGAAGAALLVAPSLVSSLVLGAPLGAGPGGVITRLYGAALLAVAAICWLARRDEHSVAARAIIAGLASYHVLTVLLLAIAGRALGMRGPLLWPAVALHAVLTMLCAGARRRAATASMLSSYRRKVARR